ncbi:hypothetical protein KSP40_PGU004778 [Platanthera guangdongensis]|uniref:Uncharacterized protein n=1 Tax=Platanthera guangdongensis TaxID=2320717 RepID=A0ABR2N3P2_9ASPA
MRVAVVGAGITGLAAAFELAKAGAEVVIYEKEDHVGGHARTVTVDDIDLDLGFMVFNRVTYPNMTEMLEKLGVEMEVSDMSFSVSLDEGKGCEWGSRNGLAGLFAQKINLINPSFWRMLTEILKFKDDALRQRLGAVRVEVLAAGSYEDGLAYGKCALARDRRLTLMIGEQVTSLRVTRAGSTLRQGEKVLSVLTHKKDKGSEDSRSTKSQLSNKAARQGVAPSRVRERIRLSSCRKQWEKMLREELEARSCQFKLGCEVQSVSSTDNGETPWASLKYGGVVLGHTPLRSYLLSPIEEAYSHLAGRLRSFCEGRAEHRPATLAFGRRAWSSLHRNVHRQGDPRCESCLEAGSAPVRPPAVLYARHLRWVLPTSRSHKRVRTSVRRSSISWTRSSIKSVGATTVTLSSSGALLAGELTGANPTPSFGAVPLAVRALLCNCCWVGYDCCF